MKSPSVGSRVRDRRWGGKYTGVITKVINGGSKIFVLWNNTVVEDELYTTEVEVLD